MADKKQNLLTKQELEGTTCINFFEKSFKLNCQMTGANTQSHFPYNKSYEIFNI